MGKIRGTHSSPGIYTKFTDISYASKNLGITTLGLVGETQMGPAFEAMPITNWDEFTKYFGGTNAEKFYGSKYPKYELPYVAKEYLSVSDQMYVCRVLGLSGYNAGPMFVIKGITEKGKEVVVAILRSKGSYNKFITNDDNCDGDSTYDTLNYYCNYITLSDYKNVSTTFSCSNVNGESTSNGWEVSSYDLGKFDIQCWYLDENFDESDLDENGVPDENKGGVTKLGSKFGVSLNAGDTDYIIDQLGTTPDARDGSHEIFVEELYDVMLDNSVSGYFNDPITAISSSVTIINSVNINPVCEPVADFVSNIELKNGQIPRKCIGQTYLCGVVDNNYKYCKTNASGVVDPSETYDMELGHVYTVKTYISGGTRQRCFVELKENKSDASGITVGSIIEGKDWEEKNVDAVKVLSYDKYYYLKDTNLVDQMDDVNDYKEEYRCAVTPWTLSELKGGGESFNVYKLFRFYTISDGNSANSLIKISIANIMPDDGTFDVYIRDYNDTDSSPSILEIFRKCTMTKGDSNYIGLKIGTVDGEFASKSKYVLVEVNESEITEQCVPCGFTGYPVRKYGSINSPMFTYNKQYDNDISKKKQYFGLSDITGVDIDMLSYKGKNAYTDNYWEGYTSPFHLDSRLDSEVSDSYDISILIDGDSNTEKLTWETVNPNVITDEGISPLIGTEYDMEGTIYEDKNMRKFTFYPYGGFDGWDPYRETRTNSDEFKANKYKGKITNGYGKTFSTISNPETYALNGKCITSDYYAYLAGINQFENVEKTYINVFATPGIDYVNNLALCNDAITMISETRGDSIYIITTPDKAYGSTESSDDMYTSEEAVMNLEDSEIDTYYTATYYPWVKYYDSDNNIYISLPVTKDVVRNLADVDNKKYPWYAPAGIERGTVNCTKARIFSKLEEEDTLYDGRINPVKTFSKDGVKIWGNKTMYTGDTPMNRINVVRLMLYMRKLIIEASRTLIFEPNDATLKSEFESIVKPILEQIQKDRGITDYRLDVSQTAEEMDAHELSCTLWVKPTPALEYIEINFMVTPQSVDFADM